MIKPHQLLLLLTFSTAFTQTSILKGNVLNGIEPLEMVHVFNTATSKGTITNKNGDFSIMVSKGEKLVFSAMPFIEQQIEITQDILITNYLEVNLSENITSLDEVKVSNHQLVGNLLLDAKKVPANVNTKYTFKIDKKELNLEGISLLNSIEDRGLNEVYQQNNTMNVGALIGKLIHVLSKKNRLKKDKLAFIQNIPSTVRKELGDNFFIEDLSIPKENIDIFLEDYCSAIKFISLYQANKKIECIEFLIEKNKLKKYCSK